MKADKESLRRPLRRSNSSGNLANRLGPRRPVVGGAAQRVAKRNLDRQRRRNSAAGAISGRGRPIGTNNSRGRSRSRSRTRTQSGSLRNRSRTRNANGNANNNRSRSRNRNRTDSFNTNNASNNVRGRSRSRSRGRVGIVKKANLSVKARLGVRPNSTGNRGAVNNRRRNASLTRRGVQTGRVQKRHNSTNTNAATSGNVRMRNRSR